MTGKVRELFDALASSRTELLSLVTGLTQDQLDHRPDPDRWSVGEVLHHLNRSERGVARLFSKRLAEAAAAGLGPDPDPDASALHRLDEARLTDRSRRKSAPEFVVPSHGQPRSELLTGLEEARASIVASVEAAGRQDLSAVVHPHPLLGPIDLYQWLLFLSQHERRHTDQIREILASNWVQQTA